MTCPQSHSSLELRGSVGLSLHQLGLSFHKNRGFLVKAGGPGRGHEVTGSAGFISLPVVPSSRPSSLKSVTVGRSGHVFMCSSLPISLVVLLNSLAISEKQKPLLAYALKKKMIVNRTFWGADNFGEEIWSQLWVFYNQICFDMQPWPLGLTCKKRTLLPSLVVQW